MSSGPAPKVALLYPGDRATRDRADPAASRFAVLFDALAAAGVVAEPAVYHDDFADEVLAQLRGVQLVLVWCNPIEDGRRRDRLDPACGGRMIDQAWQARLTEGMVRAYLVEDRVSGFGVQAVNALHPDMPTPGPRLYHGPDLAAYQGLKQQLESGWITQLADRVGLAREHLPLLWDCDFMLGDPATDGAQRFVLCEINVSSVSPFPPSSVAPLVEAVRCRAGLPPMRHR